MNILIVSPYQTVNPHFETELEIAERHQAAGDSVSILSCVGEQSLCDFNIAGDRSVCQDCRLRRKMGHQQLSRGVPVIPIFDSQHHVHLPKEIERFFAHLPTQTLGDLKRLRFENFDIGYACLSSLVSSLRDPEPDLVEHRQRLLELFRNSFAVYLSVLQRLATNRPDRVYIFNGRFAEMRAVYRAAQASEIDCYIHERGSTHNRFQLFKNHLPHDIGYMEQRIRQFWQQADPEHRTVAAQQWFTDRRARVERNWKSFTKEQKQNLLPANWSTARHNLVLFCSSEDEFAAIGDSWDQRPYPTQLAGVQHLLSLLERDDAMLTVRLHPNLKTAPRSLVQPFLELQHPQLSVVSPESPVDSYALLDQAQTCLSYGSSVGIEAVYQQKPSILLGPCYYRGLGGTYQPLENFNGDARTLPTHDARIGNLRRLLNQTVLPLPHQGALMYAYWMQENGIEYQYYRGDEFNHGKFKGTWLYPRPEPKSLRRKILHYAKRVTARAPHIMGRKPIASECDLGRDC